MSADPVEFVRSERIALTGLVDDLGSLSCHLREAQNSFESKSHEWAGGDLEAAAEILASLETAVQEMAVRIAKFQMAMEGGGS